MAVQHLFRNYLMVYKPELRNVAKAYNRVLLKQVVRNLLYVLARGQPSGKHITSLLPAVRTFSIFANSLVTGFASAVVFPLIHFVLL